MVMGATGAVGQHLLPMLIDDGHEVVAVTRTPARADALRALGALPVVADALDREAVLGAVAGAEPEVVVHQMTALTGTPDLRRFDRTFALTNRLRTEGTRHVLEAARAAGTRRVIAQSYTGWPFAREGGPVKDEDAPLDPRRRGRSARPSPRSRSPSGWSARRPGAASSSATAASTGRGRR